MSINTTAASRRVFNLASQDAETIDAQAARKSYGHLVDACCALASANLHGAIMPAVEAFLKKYSYEDYVVCMIEHDYYGPSEMLIPGGEGVPAGTFASLLSHPQA